MQSSTVLRCVLSVSWSLTPLWAVTLTQYWVNGVRFEITYVVVEFGKYVGGEKLPSVCGSLCFTS